MPAIKLICFDMDDTVIRQNSWYTLNRSLGISEAEDLRLFQDYEAGRMSYEQWNDILLERYLRHPDATRKGITEIFSRYEYAAGARESVAYLQSKGYEIVLITGSIDIIAGLVAKDLGIEHFKANNTFVFDDDDRLVSIHTQGDDTLAKARYLESFCEMLGIAMNECVCIGDGANDLEMFRRTGRGVTFVGSKIEKDAWKVIDSLKDIQTIFP